MATTNSILSSILDVFSSIGDWITGAVTDLMPMFYTTDTGLTFMGVLAVAGLAFSVAFLMIGILQRFLHFSG